MNTTRSLMKLTSLFRSFPPLQHSFSSVAGVEMIDHSIPVIERQLAAEIREQSLISAPAKHPKVICHRGRCDIYPQNTIQSINEGLLTSDLVQFDVMLTSDQQVIVFHDRYLGEITNISQIKQFQSRQTINDLNQFGQVAHNEWWTKEFTLDEIRKLSVKQKHSTRPQINNIHFSIPTLQQVIEKCIEVKSRHSISAGILIEVKTERENFSTSHRDKILLQKISAILRKHNLNTEQKCQQRNFPIIVQSFNHQALQVFHSMTPQLPLAHLYYDEDQNVSQQYITTHRTPSSIGVAISTRHLTREFIQACHKMSYEIFYWSVRDDHPEIPLGCNSYQEFYLRLKGMRLDGIITDFAANCRQAIGRLIGQNK